eukprot:scaffold194744_cov30-Tisochrysis_lutea.AAC.1
MAECAPVSVASSSRASPVPQCSPPMPRMRHTSHATPHLPLTPCHTSHHSHSSTQPTTCYLYLGRYC